MVNGDVIDRILQLGDHRGMTSGRALAGTGTRTC
jgi:hypothetical protein